MKKSWKSHYSLTLELTLGIATCCLQMNQWDDVEKFHADLIDHAERGVDKARADMLLIEMYMKRHMWYDAITLGTVTLSKRLGQSLATRKAAEETRTTFCRLVGIDATATNNISDDDLEASILRVITSTTGGAIEPDPKKHVAMTLLNMLLGAALLQTKDDQCAVGNNGDNHDDDQSVDATVATSNGNDKHNNTVIQPTAVLHLMMKLVLTDGGCSSTSMTQLALTLVGSIFHASGDTFLERYSETLRESLLLVAEGTLTTGGTASTVGVQVVDKSTRGRCLVVKNGLMRMPKRGFQNNLKLAYRLCNDAGDTDVSFSLVLFGDALLSMQLRCLKRQQHRVFTLVLLRPHSIFFSSLPSR
jgi:hypothetical protein